MELNIVVKGNTKELRKYFKLDNFDLKDCAETEEIISKRFKRQFIITGGYISNTSNDEITLVYSPKKQK